MATDLQFSVTALDKATATFIKLAEQVDRLSKKIDKLDGKKATVKADADIGKADGAIDNLGRKVKDLDGKKATVKVDVDKSLSDSLIQVARLGSALKALALPAAAVAAAPQIAAIGAAVVSATGALGVLPGVVGAGALAIGTLKTGFSGFGDAMKAAGDPKKFAEAIKTMAPAAQETAKQLRDLTNGPLMQLRQAVQQRMFAGMAGEIKGLAATYLPMLQRQMSTVASTFNVAGKSVFDFFRQKAVSSDLNGALISIRQGVQNVVLAARPMAQVFVDIFSTSAARIPILTKGVADLAVRFAGFVNNARQSGQLGQWIDKGIQTVKLLGQTVGNVGSILMSVFRSATTEGANLVKTMADVTGRIADMLKSARGQDALTSVFNTIRAAVAAVQPVVEALVPLLGTALVAAGTTLVTVFQALGPPLRDIAAALAHSLAPVLPGIATAFGQIALALVPMVAPVLALIPAFDSIAKVIAEAARVAAEFFTAFASTGAAIFKAIIPMITAAADALTVLLHIIEPIAPALGVMTAAFLAFKTAAGAISTVQGLITGAGKAIADAALNAGVFTEKVTGSAAAGEKLALAGGKLQTGLGALGVALPIVAVAAAGVALVYDQMKDKSDELTKSVADGQRTLGQAIDEQANRLQNQQMVMQEVSGETEAMGQGIGELTGQLQANSGAADANAQATQQITAEHERWLATLPPLEAAQARLKDAEDAYARAVAQFTANSPQAITAHDNLVTAKDNLKRANDDAALAEKTLGDRIVDTMNAAAGAANADVGYQQSLLTLRDAQDRAAEAAANHAGKSREVESANLAVQQASLGAAAAAQRKAEADATAAGASNVAQIGAQAYKDELLRQAETMSGPAKQALIDLANGTDTAKQASSTAEIASRLYKDELQKLADQATGPTKSALEEGKRKLDEIAASHGTAQQKADAQRAMLQRLADQTTGPTHDAIMGMITDLGNIPKETAFTVKGVGQVSYGSPELLRAAHGGYTGGVIGMNRSGLTGVAYADGGVTPGYTPGRDVHRFTSATGGTLDLSGGEAIMRPEWTSAVGPGYVRGANAAARSGGTRGVRRYMGYAAGGIIPNQAFASGGMVLTGTPFRQIPSQIFNTVAGSLVGTIRGVLDSAINRLIEQVKAAAAAAAAAARAVAGGVGIALGGGGARAWIIQHESGGNPTARNPTSTASGLYQMINGTWRAYGGSTPAAYMASVAEQNRVADRYVAARYGSWENAQAFWIRNHYYDRGGYLQPGTTLATNATGSAERVLSPAETRIYDLMTQASGRGGDGAALLGELRSLRSEVRALRGDVDQSNGFGLVAGEVRGLRYDLRGSGGSAAAGMQRDRTSSELGAWP